MAGGELKAIFKGAQEDMAQAVESAGSKMADFGDSTAQNVRDSVTAIQHADGASADAFKGIRDGLDEGGAAAEAESGANPLSWLLNGGKLTDQQRQEVNSEIDQALEKVNPKFEQGVCAYSENCTGVVQAYELTRRGISEKAGPLEESNWCKKGGSGGRPLSAITGPWGGKFKSGTKAEIEQAFKKPGSRGVVYIAWHDGGAHVFNVENVGGHVRFIDGQPDPPVKDASSYFEMGHSTAYIRLDNRPTPPTLKTGPYLEPPAPQTPKSGES